MGSGSSVEAECTESSSYESTRTCCHGYTSSHSIENNTSYWCSGGYERWESSSEGGKTVSYPCQPGNISGHQVEQSSSSYCYGP